MELLREIERLLERIPSDFGGGGSPLEKSYLMSHLAALKRLGTYVEIGVYRGRSFFPLALTVQRHGGKAYGIDPYAKDDAYESDVTPEIKECIDAFIQETDFDQIHQNVEGLIQDLGMRDTARILRATSEEAVGFFQEHGISIGMLHVDGNHDTRFVTRDVELYLPLVEPGGIVVMDDTDWDSVKPAYAWLQERMTVLFEAPAFSILINRPDGGDLQALKQELFVLYEALASRSERQRSAGIAREVQSLRGDLSATNKWLLSLGNALETTYASVQGLMEAREAVAPPPSRPKVSVSMTTYNQERYVVMAIESVLAQVVGFSYELVIADDCSTDRTGAICREYQQRHPERIRLLERSANLGAVPNYLETFKACRGDYVAFLEGDDFWTDPHKLQKQVEFLDAHPDFAICCHNVMAVDEHGVAQQRLFLHGVPEVSTVEDLCRGPDYISTPSCMVRNRLLAEIPQWLYSLEGCDWPLDILHAEKGKIHFVNEAMAAYRIHPGGIWSKHGSMAKLQIALKLCQTMDRELGYRYARCFQVYQQLVRRSIQHLQGLGDEQEPAPAPMAEADSAGSGALQREYETAMSELEKLRARQDNYKRKLHALRRANQEVLGKYERARRAVTSAEAWQNRSWVKRAFYRWREHPAERPLNLWKCLVYSLLKRVQRGFNLLMGRNAARVSPPGPEQRQTHEPSPAAASEPTPSSGSGRAPSSSPAQAPGRAEAVPLAAREFDLVILDDVFPHPLSAFRFEEFRAYLDAIPRTAVYCTGTSFPCFRESRSLEEVIAQAAEEEPLLRGRVARFKDDMRLDAKVAYLIFLGNLRTFLRHIEADRTPFVFTLYPGGYFELHDEAKDIFMRKVFSSPCFRKVIVTLSITRDYLLEKAFCQPEQIEYIYGLVTPRPHLTSDLTGKQHYGRDKARLDICFVAHKYSATGTDKGYDVFIEVAKRLAARHDNIFFHAVGGFDEHVLDVSALQGRIGFHGPQKPEWFDVFYADKDIILSPNIPFLLGGGYFDGFPTGCCTDAALHGVAMFCTDILKLNEKFTDGQDIVIIPYDVERITEAIFHCYERPEELMALAQLGCEKARDIYSWENQVAPRLRILKEVIHDETNAELFHPGS